MGTGTRTASKPARNPRRRKLDAIVKKAQLEKWAALWMITALHSKLRFMLSLAKPHRELRLAYQVPLRVTDERG